MRDGAWFHDPARNGVAKAHPVELALVGWWLTALREREQAHETPEAPPPDETEVEP